MRLIMAVSRTAVVTIYKSTLMAMTVRTAAAMMGNTVA